ncbi:MAG: hypothetical protein C4297_02565 [Gemmataceae bacterium]
MRQSSKWWKTKAACTGAGIRDWAPFYGSPDDLVEQDIVGGIFFGEAEALGQVGTPCAGFVALF